jgi:gluconolactonase
MRFAATLCLAASLVLTAANASANETTIVANVLGPEGPLYLNGNLYYVGWVSSTLSKWDGKSTTVLNRTPGCGHNGLALTKQKTFLIACDDVHGAILEVDLNGKQLRRWDTDGTGKKLDGGINDLVVAANGGVYATLSGPYLDPPTVVMGKVLYLAPSSDRWIEVADDFNYANGIGISPDQKTLYVSETVGNSIKKFTIQPDGTLANRSNFALLNLLVKDSARSWWLGPDSMKIDAAGNMYVAQWFGGKILKISPKASFCTSSTSPLVLERRTSPSAPGARTSTSPSLQIRTIRKQEAASYGFRTSGNRRFALELRGIEAPKPSANVVGQPNAAVAETYGVTSGTVPLPDDYVRARVDARQRGLDQRRPNEPAAVRNLSALARNLRVDRRDDAPGRSIDLRYGSVALIQRPNESAAGREKARLGSDAYR